MSLADLMVAVVALLASTVGAICGIGGGILIKPMLDAAGGLDVATVNFLSGSTVLAMTAYSVIRGSQSPGARRDRSVDVALALGAAAGGLLGRQLFSVVAALFENPEAAGAVQAALLLLVTVGALVYTLARDRVRSRHVTNKVTCVVIGLALGTCSSFLGIGGGPINLVVLFYFFSMDVKEAAASSLYIILFSQAVSTGVALAVQDLSAVNPWALAMMVLCGIVGGVLGRRINARIDEKAVDRLFIALMAVIICINVANFCKFAALM